MRGAMVDLAWRPPRHRHVAATSWFAWRPPCRVPHRVVRGGCHAHFGMAAPRCLHLRMAAATHGTTWRAAWRDMWRQPHGGGHLNGATRLTTQLMRAWQTDMQAAFAATWRSATG